MRRTLAYLFLTALSLLGAAAVPVLAQDKKDSLVTLVSAKSAQLIERNGESFRKVTGPARFLHNNTYLLCDSALWNVTTNIIDAVGHVQIIQDRTRLSSGSLQYVVDDDLAKFRGGLVQLEDKDKNTLRTRYLDYNTKDSVAIFQNGASMRDKDGQVIESLYGSYDSKASLFVFNDQVNMYMDTTFVKTSRLEYRSDINTAYFGYGTDMWQDDNMLSANDGWYDRDRELFFFRRNVHLLTKDQETWSDTLYYHRKVNNVEMMGQVELMDTTRNVFALAGRMEYMDSLSRVKMTVTPAVMSIDEDEKTAKRDTVWFGADTILYRGIKRHLVDSLWKVEADKRLKDLVGDPVTEYRRKAAEAAAKAAAEAEQNNPNAAGRDRGPGGGPGGKGKVGTPAGKPAGKPPVTPGEPSGTPADTTAPAKKPSPADSVAATPPPVDTSRLSFIWATSRVKLFRDDMQMSCDSLVYYDLDSLVRLYRDPLVFSDGNRQYAADSIYLVIKDRRADRARLMSNAFITTQEDTRDGEQGGVQDAVRPLRPGQPGQDLLFRQREERRLPRGPAAGGGALHEGFPVGAGAQAEGRLRHHAAGPPQEPAHLLPGAPACPVQGDGGLFPGPYQADLQGYRLPRLDGGRQGAAAQGEARRPDGAPGYDRDSRRYDRHAAGPFRGGRSLAQRAGFDGRNAPRAGFARCGDEAEASCDNAPTGYGSDEAGA